MKKVKYVLPKEIENRSFEIIKDELKKINKFDVLNPVIERVIHASADFDYVENLIFSNNVIEDTIRKIKSGVTIITDTNMAKSGINKTALKKLNCKVECFMNDDDIFESAKRNGTTRAVASMDKAATIKGPLIFAVGNAPTALIKIYDLIEKNIISPILIIGVPVGFVNVVESKNMIIEQNKIPYIVAKGRKGGSTIAAAICNALLYESMKLD